MNANTDFNTCNDCVRRDCNHQKTLENLARIMSSQLSRQTETTDIWQEVSLDLKLLECSAKKTFDDQKGGFQLP